MTDDESRAHDVAGISPAAGRPRTRRRFGTTVHVPVPAALPPQMATGQDDAGPDGGADEFPDDAFMAAASRGYGAEADPEDLAQLENLNDLEELADLEDVANLKTADLDAEHADRSGADAAADQATVRAGLSQPGPAARNRVPLLFAAAIVVLALIVTAVVIAVSSSDNSKAVPAPTAPGQPTRATASQPPSASTTPSSAAPTGEPVIPVARQRQAMQTWVGVNLSRSAVVVADPETATQLRAVGFSKSTADNALDGVDRQGVDYLVSVPSTDTASAIRTQLAGSSIPLAVFSPGAEPVTVAQVFPRGMADADRRRADNIRGQAQAGKQLPANPAIRYTANTRAVIASGTVDLRATTVLVVLAQAGTVWIRDITVDPAEARAGQPARTLTITVDNSQQAQTILAGLPVLYRPQTVTPISQATLLTVWTPAIAPVATDGS